MRSKIKFTIIDAEIKQTVESHAGEYRNLMFLLKDKMYLEYFGECGGLGKCATCVVKVIGLAGNSINKERNEPATLGRIGYADENIRLSCQIFITEDLDGAIVEILEQ